MRTERVAGWFYHSASHPCGVPPIGGAGHDCISKRSTLSILILAGATRPGGRSTDRGGDRRALHPHACAARPLPGPGEADGYKGDAE
jgi:hypothetical protein